MQHDPKGTLEMLQKRVESFVPDPGKKHDLYALASIEEAMMAAREGNLGVGVVLVNPESQIVSRGHNRTFFPYFRSDLHAEMDAMTKFEERFRQVTNMRDYTLFSSLEPCPMCTTRLITSGVGKVFYAAADDQAGMVSRLGSLAPVWIEFAKSQVFSKAQCSGEMQDLAFQIFLATIDGYLKKLAERRS